MSNVEGPRRCAARFGPSALKVRSFWMDYFRWGYNTVDVIDWYKDLYMYNKFGQSFKLLNRVVTMETAIFTLILIILTRKNR